MSISRRLGEDQIVSLLSKRFGGKTSQLACGIGDDAAVILTGSRSEAWVFTTDFLSEGIDFRAGWYTPRQLGYKCLAVNLSDVAAMGAHPRFYLVALSLPVPVETTWIREFYAGMTRLGKRHGVTLAGGDLSRSARGIQVCVSILGAGAPKDLVYRSGGKPGDHLFVTGTLGKSAAGLHLLGHSRFRGRDPAERSALRAHREPEPRCPVGAWLASQRIASCMIDISDGLSRDLPRLCMKSGTGAEICLSAIPVFADSAAWGCDPLLLAIHGGEDFELLFAVPQRRLIGFMKSYPKEFPRVTRIGQLTRHKGIFVRSHPGESKRPLQTKGFDHFLR